MAPPSPTSLLRLALLTAIALSVFGGSAWASEPFIYPAKGQDEAQQEKDKFECYGWAKKESAFDPMAPPEVTAPPPQQQQTGSPVGGAARGAARGAAVGAIAGDAGKGAAIGAGVGGARRVARNSQAQRQNAANQEQYVADQKAAYEAKRATYNRAYSVCLEGRGYTVK